MENYHVKLSSSKSDSFSLNLTYIYPMLSHLKICVLEALKGMEKVAEHINEMQRIHEEYGAIFDHLFRQHQKSCKQVNNCDFWVHLVCTYYSDHWSIITQHCLSSKPLAETNLRIFYLFQVMNITTSNLTRNCNIFIQLQDYKTPLQFSYSPKPNSETFNEMFVPN